MMLKKGCCNKVPQLWLKKKNRFFFSLGSKGKRLKIKVSTGPCSACQLLMAASRPHYFFIGICLSIVFASVRTRLPSFSIYIFASVCSLCISPLLIRAPLILDQGLLLLQCNLTLINILLSLARTLFLKFIYTGPQYTLLVETTQVKTNTNSRFF